MFYRKHARWVSLLTALPPLIDCSSRAPAESLGYVQAATVVSATLAGYTHTLDRSRFRIGQAVSLEANIATLQRWRGSLGAFALDPTNGWSMAVLDARTPPGSYILDADAQGSKVKAYFVAAGLPADQIASVGATYNGTTEFNVSSPVESQPQLQSINSILRRSVHGIRIAESVAWAKMTTGGDVDAEYVYWPAIDMSVVNAALSFDATMKDPKVHGDFTKGLPDKLQREDGVVIHHTMPTVHSTPTAFVSYDVVLGAEPSAAVRHFDSNWREFRLPQEQALEATSTDQ